MTKNLASGILLIIVSLIAHYQIRQLEFGTVGQMGPGFLPTILVGLLFILGCLMLIGSRRDERRIEVPSLRPIAAIGMAPVVFSLLVGMLGLVPALLSSLFVAQLAVGGSLVRRLVTSAALTLLCVVIFIYIVGLNIPLFTL